VSTGGSLPGGKAVGAWNWPFASSWCRGKQNVELYLHSPILLHDVALN
jgi:hypothetical protein